MFQQRRGLPVFRIVTLESFDESHGHRPVEERIFTVALLGPAPARVTAQVGVGRAHDQAAAVVVGALKQIARLVTFHRASLAEHVWVPSFGHADGLGENGRGKGRMRRKIAGSALGEAMKPFHVAHGL